MSGGFEGQSPGGAGDEDLFGLGSDLRLRPTGWERSGLALDRCFEPDSVAAMAEVVKEAGARGVALLIVGGGTRLGQANPGREIGFGLSTLGLTGVDVFEPDEGVVHARAGTRVHSVQETVGAAGWELPIDPPGATSTIGGSIASAATGPRSQAFGRVSDAILGLEVLTAEGVETKCGGRVVKNVTGYDLAKLYCGSFGTLGVVTGAWLRLRPVPEKRLALFADRPITWAGFETARRFARRRSVRAMVWSETSRTTVAPGLYCELGGGAAEVDHDAREWTSLFSGVATDVAYIDALRDARVSTPDATIPTGDELVLRGRVPGSEAFALIERVRLLDLEFDCDPGLGVVHARGGTKSAAALLDLCAFSEEKGGLMTFESLPPELRSEIDVFGSATSTDLLLQQLKQGFDPNGLFGPGRFKAGV